MIELLSSWAGAWSARPLIGAAALVVIGASLFATLRIWPRLPGPVWRVVWTAGALGYLVAMLGFIAPPPERGTAAEQVLVTSGVVARALADIEDVSDVYVTGRAWREPAVVDWLEARSQRAAPGRAVRIASLDDLALYSAGSAPLHVLGDGLPRDAWQRARWPGEITFAPPALAAGIASVRWPRAIMSGQSLVIEAQAEGSAGATESPAWVLRDARGDALSRTPADSGRIVGPVLPVGQHVLRLSLEVSGQAIDGVDFPVDVREPIGARVLVLQSAPSFEWRAIGRWLGRAGARVATRTRISDARYRDRFVDMPERDLNRLDVALLETFDLVLADGASLAELDEAARAALFDTAHGAGVLVLVHDVADYEALPEALKQVLQGDPSGQLIYQLDASADVIETGLTRLALGFNDRAGETLVATVAGDAVAARVASDSRVAVSLLRDSYRLVGVGAGTDHAQLWSDLVRALARVAEPGRAAFWPRQTRVGQRLRVCLPRALAVTAVTMQLPDGSASVLPLVSTPWRPAERCAWFWPDASGWWRASADGAALGVQWVAPYGPLSRRERLARIDATRARQQSGRGGVAPVAANAGVEQPMPRWRFFVALLAFAVLLALTERLATSRRRRAQRATDRS